MFVCAPARSSRTRPIDRLLFRVSARSSASPPLVCSLARPLICTFRRSFVRPPVCPLSRSHAHPLARSLIAVLLARLLVCRLFARLLARSLAYLSARSLVCSLARFPLFCSLLSRSLFLFVPSVRSLCPIVCSFCMFAARSVFSHALSSHSFGPSCRKRASACPTFWKERLQVCRCPCRRAIGTLFSTVS